MPVTIHVGVLGARGRMGSEVVRAVYDAPDLEVVASLDMMPGVVSLPHGWGHGRPGVQMTIASSQPGASANDLTDERQLEELSGNAALNGEPVQVAAA